MEAALWQYWVRGGLVIATVAVMTLGRSQQPATTAALIEDKTYPVTPPSVTVRVGIVTGEITDMKVTQRVEQGSGRVVSPAKLTGTLKLKNPSVDQSVRLVSGRIQYIDARGRLIAMVDGQQEPTIKFAGYGTERLDPGHDATHSLEAHVPAFEVVRARPDLIVLLGVDADQPEPAYGWIEPGDSVPAGPWRGLFRVLRFWEKHRRRSRRST